MKYLDADPSIDSPTAYPVIRRIVAPDFYAYLQNIGGGGPKKARVDYFIDGKDHVYEGDVAEIVWLDLQTDCKNLDERDYAIYLDIEKGKVVFRPNA